MNKAELDISLNRKSMKYCRKDILRRILWGICKPLFHFSPRILFSWRCFLLKIFGAKIGKHVHIYNSSIIYMPWNLEVGDWSSIGENVLIYNLGKVTVGSKTTISHRAHLCAGTHDYTNPTLPLEKAPIIISDQAWVCADSFIGPGICVGKGAVVGSRAVAMKDVKEWTIVAGNPATFIKKRILQ